VYFLLRYQSGQHRGVERWIIGILLLAAVKFFKTSVQKKIISLNALKKIDMQSLKTFSYFLGPARPATPG